MLSSSRSRAHRAVALVPLVASLALSLVPAAARAREEPELERCIERLDDEAVRGLITRVEPRIRQHQRRARWWFWGWMAANFGFVVGSTAFAIHEDDPTWKDAYRWSAAGSGLTMLTLLLPPLPSAFASRRLGARADRDERAHLARVLRLLDSAAAQEHAARAWWTHTANASFALAEGLYLGLRHDDAVGVAVSNALISLAVAETQAFTSPRAMTRLRRELEAEGAPCLAAASAASRPSIELAPLFGGLSMTLRF